MDAADRLIGHPVWVHWRTGVAHFRPSCPSLSCARRAAVRQERYDPSHYFPRCGICWPKNDLPQPLFEDERLLPS